MNYGKISKVDASNGPGCRVTVFFSGCHPNKCSSGHCIGCHNPEAWNFNYGKEFTEDTASGIITALAPSYISGLSLLGGEVYDQDESFLVKFLEKIKILYPYKSIWAWTGYEFGQVKDKKLTKYIDVLVVGNYDHTKRDITGNNLWRGSTNQRVIDVKRSLTENMIIPFLGIPNNNI